MPTWSDMASFLADVERTVGDLQRDEARRITREMATRARSIAIDEARRDFGGDAAFTRGRTWAGEDRSLESLTVKPSAHGAGHWVYPTRRSGGPWKVAEEGRNQGDARGRGGAALFAGPSINRRTGDTYRTAAGNVRNTRSRRSGRWNGYTTGRRTASRAVDRIEREAPVVAEREVHRVLVKRFDVT